jgi:hypothetical protein
MNLSTGYGINSFGELDYSGRMNKFVGFANKMQQIEDIIHENICPKH